MGCGEHFPWAGPRDGIDPILGDLGLTCQDLAEVETPVGRLRLKAGLSAAIRPDTIHIPQGWEEANANELTGAEAPDPVSGFPNLKSNRCRIRKVSIPRE